jgi:hypothetical protein
MAQHPARGQRPREAARHTGLIRQAAQQPEPGSDTIPVPSPVTSRPFDHTVTFISGVLLELDQ